MKANCTLWGEKYLDVDLIQFWISIDDYLTFRELYPNARLYSIDFKESLGCIESWRYNDTFFHIIMREEGL